MIWPGKTLVAIALFALCPGLTGLSQTDAPPELRNPQVPGELPPLEEPEVRQQGKLRVQFVGNSSFSEGELREGIERQIAAIEEFGLDEPNAYDAAFFLELFYRKQGYTQVAVQSRITGPWQLVLIVDEGPRAKVRSITIEGNKAYGDDTIMDYLLGPTRERFPKLKEIVDLPFVESDVVQGIKLVERLYSAEGFLDAVVNDPEFVLTEDNTQADITLVIVEGTKYTFGPVRFEGNVVFPPGQLLVEIADVASDVFTDGRMAAARRKVEDFYREHGYYAAEVEAVGKPEQAGYDGQVPVTFWIDSGPVYRFDGITVSGNSGVRESFLRQRFAWMQGRVYNPELVDKQFRELIETGLFRDLGIDPKPIEGDQLRLDITVKEARPKEFGIGIGFATFYGGIFSLSYGDRNFLRSGRPFEAKIELNQRGYSGEVTYRDPWFLETRYKLLLRAHALNEQFDGYLKQESGAQARLSRNFNEHWEVSAYVKGKHVTVEDIKIEPVELAGPDEYTVAAIGFSQSIDYRNNPLLPTRGFIFDVAAEFAPNGLSDFSYIRAVGRFSWHIQVTERSSFALGARGGTIAPLARQDVPIDERFFVGGATTVRSFAERELGPQDARGHPIGGRTYSVFNAEYTFPIVGDLQGAVFFDAGNLMPRTGEWGADSMRYAVGAGLRYNLPIGALRFDYGHNPSPVEGENSGAFHLAIGFAF